MGELYVALIHYPVVNRKGNTVGSAVTNMDIHDIARACATFGVKRYYVVTPYADQAILVEQIMAHWTSGAGGQINPSRKAALERVRVSESLETACAEIKDLSPGPLVKVATSARGGNRAVNCAALKERLEGTASSHVLIFGTAWGLTQELIDQCDLLLEPIKGRETYNHLSVRSAASIYLDRLTNGG